MAEKKKREAVYDPVAQKKWSDKNRAKKNVNTRRSNAKRFIREDATLEELDELQALIEERRETLDMWICKKPIYCRWAFCFVGQFAGQFGF